MRIPFVQVPVFSRSLLVAIFLLHVGCGATMIPNTSVEDNDGNREVLEFMERYRHAVEDRDVDVLLGMAAASYYDDNGTPRGDDDLDYDTLRVNLSEWNDSIVDCRYEIRYRDIEWREDRKVYVTYRYTASFQVTDADGEQRWVRRLGDNRVVLAMDGSTGTFSILTGM
ncbi:MAG: hypothetical protein AAF550_13740 [Myxococcota bacterium]